MANALKIGSIIHLQSGKPDWGYLNMLGWTTDIPIISFVKSATIRAVLATHTQKDFIDNSGSWQILSANNKKQLGADLVSGDKIHLLNMHPGVGYLDTFEHVYRLQPFASYYPAMKIGVFSANVPNRGGGVSGIWTIHLKPADPNRSTEGEPIKENSTVYLENEYSGAGFLFAHADSETSTVPKHTYVQDGKAKQLFETDEVVERYKDAKKFVFTGSAAQNKQSNSSYEWTITPVNSGDFAQSLYRVETQWGSDTTPWHDAGIFKIGDGESGRVKSLTWQWDDLTKMATGQVTFKRNEAETNYDFEAAPTKNKSINHYDVALKTANDPITQAWRTGSRNSQRVVHISLKPPTTADLAFDGTIQYEDEKSIAIRGLARSEESPDHDIEYDFHNPDLLRGRAQKMRGVIDTTHKLLSDVMEEFDKQSSENLTDAADKQKREAENKQVDFAFQQWQLAHLQLLSKKLNGFYAYQLKPLMKQAFKEHRDDQTLAPHHIVRSCFRNLAIDHEIIQRAAVQRRWTQGNNSDAGAFMSEQAMELLIMDKLAIKALAPFKRLLPIENNQLAVITYLSDKTHIRHVPYSDQIILVGVSYDRVPQVGILFDDKSLIGEPFHAFELMAIPHEIAHFVYEHGQIEVDGEPMTFPQISQRFEHVNPYYKWCEEIFADLYGCIVAGPLAILSMQALLVSIDRDRAWKDDHDHPTPVLRVFVLNEMLRILKDVAEKEFASDQTRMKQFDFLTLPDLLDENWTATLEKWGYGDVESLYLSDIFVNAEAKSKRPERIYQHDQSAPHLDQIINIDRVLNTIRPIVEIFATHLLKHVETAVSAPNDSVLQVDIPWVTPNEAKDGDLQLALGRFNQEMRAITDRAFARRTTTKPALNEAINRDLPEKSIQEYLEGWGEHGPSGTGGHTV